MSNDDELQEMPDDNGCNQTPDEPMEKVVTPILQKGSHQVIVSFWIIVLSLLLKVRMKQVHHNMLMFITY